MESSARQQRHHHALAIPTAALGHSTPLMRFCKRLASHHAFTITFLSIQPCYSPLAHHQQAATSSSPSSDPIDQWLRLLGKHSAHTNSSADPDNAALYHLLGKQEHAQLDIRRAHLPLDLSKLQLFSYEGVFEALQNLAPLMDQLLSKLMLQDPPVTCLISDLYMTCPTQRIADKFNLPRIVFHTASYSVLLLMHYIQQGQVSLDEALKVVVRKEASKGGDDVFAKGLHGLPTLKNDDLLDCHDNNPFFYANNSRMLEESRGKACALVVNSFEELEGPALSVDIGFPIYAVGPLMEPVEKEISTSLWEDDEGCMLWLNEQPPQSVLYISFGSFCPLSNAQFEEIVSGLLSGQQRFLWVFRSNLVKDAHYPSFPADWLSNGRGYSTEWVPQLRVLSHPSVGGFLTHCGWNSTIEAISFGVPMICFPYISDQFMNAKFITEEWKTGLGFKVRKANRLVERGEVERVVKALMAGEEGKLVRRNAEHFKEASDHKLAREATSRETLEALVQSLG